MSDNEYIERLRADFSSPESRAGMSDIDMLALLLSYTNCKNRLSYVLNRLITHFGSAGRCYFAGYDELMSIDGMTRQAAILILATARSYMLYGNSVAETKPDTAFDELFLSIVRNSHSEAFWAASVDETSSVVAIERICAGESALIEMSVSAVVLFAGRYGAKQVVLAHSHPDTDTPILSKQDIKTMQYVSKALETLGIRLLGQVVVAGERAKFFEYVLTDSEKDKHHEHT